MPWRGPGGAMFGLALLGGLLTLIALVTGASDAASEAAFDAGTGTVTATVDAYVVGWRGSESFYRTTYEVAGETYHGRLADYESPGPRVGTTTTIEYAESNPLITRTPGYDSHDATMTGWWMAGISGSLTLAMLVGWAVMRGRARRAGDDEGR